MPQSLLSVTQRGDALDWRAMRGVALLVALLLMAARLEGALLIGDRLPAVALAACAVVVALSLAAARFRYGRAANVLTVLSIFKLGSVDMGFWSIMSFRVGRRFPPVDATLARLDRSVGFDWPSYMRFMDVHAWMNTILYPAYMSIFWQPLLIAVALLLAEKDREAIKLMLTMTIGLMATLLVACLMPAYGAYHYFGFAPSMHPHIADLVTGDGISAALDWLRSENPSGSLPDNHGGLATFPSFHTAAALLFIWYSRGLGRAFAAFLLLNAAMLVATPLHGSHYLVDMLGGALVAALAIAVVEALLGARMRLAAASPHRPPRGGRRWRATPPPVSQAST